MRTFAENALRICAAACVCAKCVAIACAVFFLILFGTVTDAPSVGNAPVFTHDYLSFVYQPGVLLDFDVVFRFLFSVALFFILLWTCSIMFKSYEFLNNFPSSLFLFFALPSTFLHFATEVFVLIDHFRNGGVLYLNYPVLFPFVERLALIIPLFCASFSVVLQLRLITSRLSSEHIFFTQPSGLPVQSYPAYLYTLILHKIPAIFARRAAHDMRV